MAKVILGVVWFFIFARGVAQSVNYRDLVFTNVTVMKNGNYGPTANGHLSKAFSFDCYRAAGDSGIRPLIIWLHGGGFRFGSKRAKGMRIWCSEFARRGYVSVAMNYRMERKNTLFRFGRLVAGCADAVDDTRMALAYFKKHAREFGIDTMRIVLAGNSAGGMTALQTAYSLPGELRRLAGDSVRSRDSGRAGDPDRGDRPVSSEVGAAARPPGESASQAAQQPFRVGADDWTGATLRANNVAAVVNFWGALFDTRWLLNARVPIVSVYGTRDRIVDPGRRNFFAGPEALHESADSVGIPNKLKAFEGFSHELQRPFNPFFSGSGAHRRWKEAGQFAADFLAEEWTRRSGQK
jgi:acetyl esterase/lipase